MGAQPHVIVIDGWRGQYVEDVDLESELLAQVATVSLLRVHSPQELFDHIEDADAIISWHTVPLPADVLRRLRKCKGIVRAAVGFDNIDISYAAELEIPVCNVPDYGTEEVADHTLALMLSALRKIQPLHQHVRHGGWDWRAIGNVPRLRGCTWGIVGLGRIGTAVAKRAQAFGITVGFYDPYVPNGIDKALAIQRFETLDELLMNSQIVSLHVPLSASTQHIIGQHELQLMKNTVLINTARGPLINQNALVEALETDAICHVALDVLEEEPQIPGELIKSDKVTVTPHAAFYSDDVLPELRRKAALAVRRLLLNEPERCVVNDVKSIRGSVSYA